MLSDGEIGVGTRFKETRVMFGKESSEIMEITRFAPHDFFTEEARSSGMHYVSNWSFVENEGCTRVSIDFTGTATTSIAVYEKRSSSFSVDNAPRVVRSSGTISAARRRFRSCNAAIFSSTVSAAMIRYAVTGRV